jgi:hypothetical protein
MKTFRDYKVTCGPNGSVELSVAGTTLSCLDSTAEFRLSIEDASPFLMARGLGFRMAEPFTRLRIDNPTAANLDVSLMVGWSEFADNRLSLSATSLNSRMIRSDAPSILLTGADVTCASGAVTAVAAANPAREELMLVNGSGVTIRVGVAPGAGVGLPMGAGATMVLRTTAAVSVWQASGGSIAVSVAETRWV